MNVNLQIVRNEINTCLREGKCSNSKLKKSYKKKRIFQRQALMILLKYLENACVVTNLNTLHFIIMENINNLSNAII